MDHHCIVNQRLDISYREITLVLTCESPCHVDGRQGHVEVKCECLFLSGLAVSEAGILLAVPQQELDLEPCPVDVHDVFCRHFCVGGEEHLPGLSLLARLHTVNDDYAYIALQACCLDDISIESDRLAFTVIVALFLEHIQAEVIKVHLPVHLLWSAFLACLRSLIKILQADIIAEPADQVKAQHGHTADKRLFREECISGNSVADFLQRILFLGKRAEIPCRKRVGILHSCNIPGRSAYLDRIHRLDSLQMYCILLISINHCNVKNLQSMLGSRSTARPEVAHARCMIAALVDVARINGQGDTMPGHMGNELTVVAHPVELLLEVLAESALTGVSETGHLHEIDAFWYAQVKNHCLDEERLKTFCYLCSAIEGIFDDFGELVKWHLVHIVTGLFATTKLLKISDLTKFLYYFFLPVNTIYTTVFDGSYLWSETCPPKGQVLSPIYAM